MAQLGVLLRFSPGRASGEQTSGYPGCGGQRLRPGLRFQGGALSAIRRSVHRQRCVDRVLRAVKGDGCMGRAPADRRRLGPSKRSPFTGEVVEAVLAALERRGCAAHSGGVAGTGEGSLHHVGIREMRQRRQRFDRIVAVGRICPRQLDGFPLVTLRCRSAEAVWVA